MVTLGAAGTLVAVTIMIRGYALSGLAVDRGAIRSWLTGDGLYAYHEPGTLLGSAISPPGAFALTPLALLPLPVGGWVLALAGLAALTLAMVALVGPIARRHGRPAYPIVVVVVLLALATEPVRAALGLGRWDLVLFGLVVADLIALRRSAWARSRELWWPRRATSAPRGPLGRVWATGSWAGVGIGLATALAVSPGLFILYLALTRRWRAALTALGTAATLAAAALLVAPSETAAWFGEVLWRLDRTGGVERIGNQSLAGVLARLYNSATTPLLLWASFALLLVAVGFIRARAAHREGDEITAFTLVGVTGAVVGPVTLPNELIWVLPGVLLMVAAGVRERWAAVRPRPGLGGRYPGLGWFVAAGAGYLLFLFAPMWTSGDVLVRNAYAIALIVMVNALPWSSGAAPAFPIDRWTDKRRSLRT
ncbi:glycosyltransferase 87 family protein [Actinoplanes sp. NPDC049265]|uniref:glycosyltransferase 87 family protein n=1 Tax=Actinoplanes sp. NPDC049265 TaxID=3363902 RepID=UPI00371D8FA4